MIWTVLGAGGPIGIAASTTLRLARHHLRMPVGMMLDARIGSVTVVVGEGRVLGLSSHQGWTLVFPVSNSALGPSVILVLNLST